MIRIATWNLGVPPKIAIQNHLAKIAEVQADIWILTETRENYKLSDEFTCVAQSKSGVLAEDRLWTAIWVRKSLVEGTEKIDTSDEERTACTRLVMPNKTTVFVYGTVLPWRGDQRYGKDSAGGVAFSKALAEQKADWANLCCKNRDSILVVAGDFNQDLLETRAYYNSKEQRKTLKKVLDELELRCLTELEADPVARQCSDQATIDHICVGGPLPAHAIQKPPSEACPPVYQGKKLSDHFIVFADVDLALK